MSPLKRRLLLTPLAAVAGLIAGGFGMGAGMVATCVVLGLIYCWPDDSRFTGPPQKEERAIYGA